MKLNTSKTNMIIVSRSRTMHPQSPPLTIGGTALKEFMTWIYLGVTVEKHFHLVSTASSQSLGILSKS